MNKQDILKRQLAINETATVTDLENKFQELYGFECSQTNVRNLRKRIAYKLQEMYFGGLSVADKSRLAEIADSDPLANLQTGKKKARKIVKGTRFQRDWKGKTYEVIVHEDGQYEYDGVKYRSLSAIADKITGSHWNGKKFFGVK